MNAAVNGSDEHRSGARRAERTVVTQPRATHEIESLLQELQDGDDATGRTPGQAITILEDLAEDMIGRNGFGDRDLRTRIATEIQARPRGAADETPATPVGSA